MSFSLRINSSVWVFKSDNLPVNDKKTVLLPAENQFGC